MKLSTLLLGFLVLAAGAVAVVSYRKATEDARAWRRLLALEGRDLRKQPGAWSLVNRALVRSRILELENSPNAWVREAARLAARVLSE